MLLTRRTFVRSAAAGAGTLLGGGLPAASRRKPVTLSPLHAPFLRCRLSLAAYSLRKYMQQNWPAPRKRKPNADMTMDDFVDYCAKLNLDGCELTSYYFPKVVTGDYLARLRIKALWNRLDVSGTAIGNDFCLPDGPARRKQLSLCRQWIDYAALMGAPAIRIFAGRVPKGDTQQAAIARCIAGIDESLKYAATKRVGLALENHGGITATPAQMLRIVQGVKPSPWFGVNFDSGNFRTDDPYRDLAKIAPYAINAQIKLSVVRRGKREPADLKKTLRILDEAGYRGWIALEYEERGDPIKEIPQHIDRLRDAMAGI
ncbi:MAG: sugar phosphate isomerase/epimerase family protein [Planctomycetaceae bacterium]